MSAWAERRRRSRDRLLGALVRLLVVLVRPLGWRGAQTLGRSLGALAWHVGGRERRRTIAHLTRAFPELEPAAVGSLAQACWRHLGETLGETLALFDRGRAGALEHLDVVGLHHLEAATASGRPVLALTGHCGNWELTGAYLGDDAWAIVRAKNETSVVDQLVRDYRARLGVAALPRGTGEATKALLGVLKRPGAVLALLADQDFDAEGVLVPFFGHLAHTPVGPARLALKRKALVVPCFDERLANGRHRLTFEPPLELPEDEVGATAVMTAVVEAQIRRAPAQWVWMHRRWRRADQAATKSAEAP